jgi:hypothetical protein
LRTSSSEALETAATSNTNLVSGSFREFFEAFDGDFLNLKQLVKIDHKKGFPYLSGPKIFNYWSFIISTYGKVNLSNRDHIEIAPDTHITQCSVKLGVITSKEAITFTKDAISERWRELLKESGIDPIDMHPPLWLTLYVRQTDH